MGISAEFEKMAKKVQKYARNQQQPKGMSDMIQQLEKVFMQSCDELKKELKQLKTQKDELKLVYGADVMITFS
jgi:hypothetical protein